MNDNIKEHMDVLASDGALVGTVDTCRVTRSSSPRRGQVRHTTSFRSTGWITSTSTCTVEGRE